MKAKVAPVAFDIDGSVHAKKLAIANTQDFHSGKCLQFNIREEQSSLPGDQIILNREKNSVIDSRNQKIHDSM